MTKLKDGAIPTRFKGFPKHMQKVDNPLALLSVFISLVFICHGRNGRIKRSGHDLSQPKYNILELKIRGVIITRKCL
jgi:hypothetical protein